MIIFIYSFWRYTKEVNKISLFKFITSISAIYIWPKKFCSSHGKKLGIKLIFFGENPSQYGGFKDEEKSPKAAASYFTYDESEKILISGLTLKELEEKHNINKEDLKYHLPHTVKEFDELKLDIHYLGSYLIFHSQKNYYAREKVGFLPDDQRTEGTFSRYNSIDDKLDGYHYWTGFIKFGVGRTTHEASQEIRNGDLIREEAVSLVNKYDGELPRRYFDDVLEYLDFNEKEFIEIANSFRPKHLWEKDKSGKYKLKFKVS